MFYLLAAVCFAAGYFLYYRPKWMTPEVLIGIPAFLRDPSTPPERLRQTALDGHQLILSGFQALDAAIILILIISIGAAVMLVYVALKLRAQAQKQDSAL
jgi:hypothetical protein